MDNPVDWFEWGEKAFQAAKDRNVPIFLSIGYAACHWCHVMASESFEDPEIAKVMNEGFVNIKVDREERPDIDAIYMSATQAISGHGGWPMTLFLDHSLQPYYAGTYFPPTERHGLPSFRELLGAMSDAWQNEQELIGKSTLEIVAHLRAQNSKLNAPAIADAEVLEGAINQLRREFDSVNGGFGGAPKFPPHSTLKFLLRLTANSANPEVQGWIERTAMKMASGGMYDQLGGGFARYSVDTRWLVPHFEKMLYDNALLISVYAELVLRSDNERFFRVLRDSVDFVLRELSCETGGFASSLDADTEHEEGKFYVFDFDELVDALGSDAEGAAALYGVSEHETFEHGKSVLQFLAEREPDNFEHIKKRLFDHRERRTKPGLDAKILTGWNGWMISALFRASNALNDPAIAIAARQQLDYLLSEHLVAGKLYRSSLQGNLSEIPAQLEDYSGLGQALLDAHGQFGEKKYFDLALWFGDQILERFVDDGLLFDTEAEHTQTPVRPRTLTDSGYPSAHSVSAELFRQLGLITGGERFTQAARTIIGELTGLMANAPGAMGSALSVQLALSSEVSELAIVGVGSELHSFALRLPDRGFVLSVGEPGATPLLEGREQIEGKATAYLCQGFSCKLPVTRVEDLAKLLAGDSGSEPT